MPAVRLATPVQVAVKSPISRPLGRAFIPVKNGALMPLAQELGGSLGASTSRTTALYTINPPSTLSDDPTFTATGQPPTQVHDPLTSTATAQPPPAVTPNPVAFTAPIPAVLAGSSFTAKTPGINTPPAPAMAPVDTRSESTPAPTSAFTTQPPTTIIDIPNPTPTTQPPLIAAGQPTFTATGQPPTQISDDVPVAFTVSAPQDVKSSFTEQAPPTFLIPTSTPLLVTLGGTSQAGAFDIPGLSATTGISPTGFSIGEWHLISSIAGQGASGIVQEMLGPSASGVAPLLYSLSGGVLVTLTPKISNVGTSSTVVAGSVPTGVSVSAGADGVLSSIIDSVPQENSTPDARGATSSPSTAQATQSAESLAASSESDGVQLNNTIGNKGSKDATWSPKVVAGVLGAVILVIIAALLYTFLKCLGAKRRRKAALRVDSMKFGDGGGALEDADPDYAPLPLDEHQPDMFETSRLTGTDPRSARRSYTGDTLDSTKPQSGSTENLGHYPFSLPLLREEGRDVDEPAPLVGIGAGGGSRESSLYDDSSDNHSSRGVAGEWDGPPPVWAHEVIPAKGWFA